MEESGNSFVPRYAGYARIVECSEDALDEYGRWLGEQVRAWDPSADSVEELRDLLEEVREVLGAINLITSEGSGEERYGIDMSDLSSMPAPDGIDTGYPIWAIDARGGALTGECADQVSSLAEILAELE